MDWRRLLYAARENWWAIAFVVIVALIFVGPFLVLMESK